MKKEAGAGSESESFFRLPLGEEDQETKQKVVVVARTFRIGWRARGTETGRAARPFARLMPTATFMFVAGPRVMGQ